ncbi:MAG TPA: SWIM zinc finger family protein, partial [Gemmatimonadaceae bacterium]
MTDPHARHFIHVTTPHSSTVIPRAVAAGFPLSVRGRGDDYFKSRRVRIARASASRITAVVRGSRDYRVEITAEQGMLSASCTCPFAADNGVCKHIWATLRCADVEGKLDALVTIAGRNAELVTLDDDDLDEIDISVDAARAERPPVWKTLLDDAGRQMAYATDGREVLAPEWRSDRRVVYIVDLPATRTTAGIVVELATERRKRDGTWEPPAQFRGTVRSWQTIPDQPDRLIAQMLIGATPNPYGPPPRPGPFVLAGSALETVLPLICETGRCRVRREAGERPLDPVGFDPGSPWTLHVRVARDSGNELAVDAVLRRADDEMPIGEPAMVHSAGVLLARGVFARFDHSGAFALVPAFRQQKRLTVRDADLPALLETLHALPHRPKLELPGGTQITESREAPQPGVVIHPDPNPWRKTHHRLEPFFLYGAVRLTGAERAASAFDRASLTICHRDFEREREARERLLALGAKQEWDYRKNEQVLTVPATKLTRQLFDLVAAGWRVEAEGSLYRAPGEARASVRSGIDWFELSAGVRYGDLE